MPRTFDPVRVAGSPRPAVRRTGPVRLSDASLGRLGIDPAVVSARLISTLVDGTGLVIYFEIAKFLLRL